MIMLAMLAMLAVSALLIGAAGCGGSDDKTSQQETKTNPAAEIPPPALRPADSAAFSELRRGSGVLRAAAIPVAYGAATRIVVAPRLRAEAVEVRQTRPRSPRLRSLRARTLAALRLASSPGAVQDGTAKQIARDSIKQADRIDAGLRRYAASNPAANDLQPGSSG
jgi:hypothetical protein